MSNKKKIIIHTKKHGDFNVIIWYDEKDRAYLVRVPSLPEVVTFGKTLSEAKKMVADAIELYCECTIDEGKIIIDDTRRIIGRLPKSNIISVIA